MAKSFVAGKSALATATVGVNLSLRSFKYFLTFRHPIFPLKGHGSVLHAYLRFFRYFL